MKWQVIAGEPIDYEKLVIEKTHGKFHGVEWTTRSKVRHDFAIDEDMAMLKLLGLNPQKPFIKKMQPETVEAQDSEYETLGEKPKWTRPEHKIDRNEEAKLRAKELLR